MHGQGQANAFQLKFVDASGENAWWRHQPDFVPPAQAVDQANRQRQIAFAWRPTDDKLLKRIAAIGPVVASGQGGEAGRRCFDRLHRIPTGAPQMIIPDPAPATATAAATATATASAGITLQPPAPGRQVAQSAALTAQVQATLPYWLYLPPGNAADPQRRWPLLVFLHGSGERGSDLQSVKQQGPPSFIEARPDLPFIVVSPQAPADGAWDPHLLHALLGHLKGSLRIDADRVSATGLSMGGRGTWAWAIDYPQDLAAIAPVCGEGDEDRMARIKHLPVWAFHGEADSVVPIDLHRRAIQALREAGGQPRLTTYPGVGHDAWTPAYAEPGLFDWLLAQRRGQTPPR